MNSVSLLVVEDHEIQQKVVKMILVSLGYAVDIAENGKKALAMFKKNEYDLIFMDIGLPDMSGAEVTKEIRAIENKESHIPIVALTANYDESNHLTCLEAGMDDFILKPLQKEAGQKMINKILKEGVVA